MRAQLYKISWTLTPQVGTILRMFEKGQPKSLQQLAVIGNSTRLLSVLRVDVLSAVASRRATRRFRQGAPGAEADAGQPVPGSSLSIRSWPSILTVLCAD